VASPQPERSEFAPTVGSRAPAQSLADAHAEASPGAVWLTVCAWCNSVRVQGRWIDAITALQLIGPSGSYEPQFTHGICPECFDEATPLAG
jgi:NMD protein affecting ribosome stability and mRNA decay